MQRPGHIALIMLFVCMLCVAFLRVVLRNEFGVAGPEPDTLSVLISVAVFAVCAAMGVYAFRRWVELRRVMRELVAGWWVSPETWEKFAVLDADLRADDPDFGTLHRKIRGRRKEPVAVLAGARALVMDGALFPIASHGRNAMTSVRWLRSDPECLEFTATQISTGKPGVNVSLYASQKLLRVPIAPEERAAATHAFSHYQQRLTGGALAEAEPTQSILLTVLLFGAVCAPLAVLGFWMEANGVMAHSTLPFLLALLGTVGAGLAFLLAIIQWVIRFRARFDG